MPDPDSEICSHCEFEYGGECRRYPPIYQPETETHHSSWFWPMVDVKEDFCGEFKKAEDAKILSL